jgi:LPXTG-motif cell wall-anchored protein
MRRFLPSTRRVLAAAGAAAAGFAAAAAMSVPASGDPGATPAVDANAACVGADQARYAHTFTLGASTATATIELVGAPLCDGQSQAFTLVSYITPASTFAVPQYVFDSATGTLTREQTKLSLKVDIPACYTQVDFVFGTDVINPLVDGGDRYGDRKVGSAGAPGNRSTAAADSGSPQHAWFNGGAARCTTAPRVEAVPNCDGSVDLSLRNGPGANISAIFRVTASGGYSQTTVVGQGKLAQVHLGAGHASDIRVTLNGSTVRELSWAKPAGCAPATVSSTSDCAGLTVTVANPQGGDPVEATLASDKPETKTLALRPGETGRATFAARPGLTVTVTIGEQRHLLTFPQSGSCAPGTGGGLPQTGAKTGWYVGAALGLLALGGALFGLARRRRVTFTS